MYLKMFICSFRRFHDFRYDHILYNFSLSETFSSSEPEGIL